MSARTLSPEIVDRLLVRRIVPEWFDMECDWSAIRDSDPAQKQALALLFLVELRRRKAIPALVRALNRWIDSDKNRWGDHRKVA